MMANALETPAPALVQAETPYAGIVRDLYPHSPAGLDASKILDPKSVLDTSDRADDAAVLAMPPSSQPVQPEGFYNRPGLSHSGQNYYEQESGTRRLFGSVQGLTAVSAFAFSIGMLAGAATRNSGLFRLGASGYMVSEGIRLWDLWQ